MSFPVDGYMRHKENMNIFLMQSHDTQNTQMVFISLEVTVVFLFNQMVKDKLYDIEETTDHKFYRSW